MRTALEELFEKLMNESCEDASCGTIEDIGYHALFRHPLTIVTQEELDALDPEDREALESCAGVIVREDSYGFIDVWFYDTIEELDATWAGIMEDEQRFYAEDEEF